MKLSEIKKKLNCVKNEKKIIAALIFGSYARNEYFRDIDICLILDKKYTTKDMNALAIRYSGELSNIFDIKIFQKLPVYIRKKIFEEGKIIFCKDEDRLYEIALDTLKEFEFYKKIYYNYIDSIQ